MKARFEYNGKIYKVVRNARRGDVCYGVFEIDNAGNRVRPGVYGLLGTFGGNSQEEAFAKFVNMKRW